MCIMYSTCCKLLFLEINFLDKNFQMFYFEIILELDKSCKESLLFFTQFLLILINAMSKIVLLLYSAFGWLDHKFYKAQYREFWKLWWPEDTELTEGTLLFQWLLWLTLWLLSLGQCYTKCDSDLHISSLWTVTQLYTITGNILVSRI